MVSTNKMIFAIKNAAKDKIVEHALATKEEKMMTERTLTRLDDYGGNFSWNGAITCPLCFLGGQVSLLAVELGSVRCGTCGFTASNGVS